MISVLILTLNEAANIAGCIEALPWRDDVHVLDSCSEDDTCDIARTMGAHVTEHPFVDYADQRNFGLALPFLHDWIVMIDADERMTRELAEEVEREIESADDAIAMFCVRRKDMFMDRWLRRSSGYPTWFPRILRRGRVRVSRKVNEVYECDGRIVELAGHLLHYPFNKGIGWWFVRHGRYSDAESDLLASGYVGGHWGGMFSRNPLERRASLKRIAYKLPGRPFLTFMYLYVLRLGFLDGWAGYTFASMRMAYEIMIDSKTAFKIYQSQNSSRTRSIAADPEI